MIVFLRMIFLLALLFEIGCGNGPAHTEHREENGRAVDAEIAIQTALKEDWCAGHALPESMCTKCNPSLIAGFKASGDWCKEHGFPESACPTCNPRPVPGQTAEPAVDWCAGHALPESMCTKCNPGFLAQYQETGDWCASHGFPESACPVCNPRKPPAGVERNAIEARIVRFRTPGIETAAGIQTAEVKRVHTSSYIECTARIAFDQDRVAEIRAIVPGIIRKNHVGLGESVAVGDPLFELESTRVGDIQSMLLGAREHVRVARANLERQRALRKSGIASDRDVEITEQELAAARAEVDAADASLRMTGAGKVTPSGSYTLSAPIAGVIARRPAVVGLFAGQSTSLATIVDTSEMWVLCDVPDTDADSVRLGQDMHVTVEGGRGEAVHAEVTWIAPEVDPRTRTVLVRASAPNAGRGLKANQFARARIQTSLPLGSVSVPRAALQRVGEREVVFVRKETGVFEPRVVRSLGRGDLIPIEGNLKVGERVVTTGAVLLRTEIMPGSIGAGCCEIGTIIQETEVH